MDKFMPLLSARPSALLFKNRKATATLRILFTLLFFATQHVAEAQSINLTGPVGSGQFGSTVTVLTNGNYVVTDPVYDDGAITDVGAVYLYNGSTHALISTLKGSTAIDQVGNGGITALSNGNFVVRSTIWDNGAATDAGAVTWGSGTTGIAGIVSSSNSLVGGTVSDNVGSGGITALSNGNYVVGSSSWDNGAATNAGAVTWCNGSIGITGVVSSGNSLVGSTANDNVGSVILALSNGNYVVTSGSWGTSDFGAVTWGNGSTGITGVVSSSNSLVGSTANDFVGAANSIALSNGNYLVRSEYWSNGGAANAGAVTWGNGSTGITGIVSSSNSLVGTTANDQVGSLIAFLSNGNYVVYSPRWGATDFGAVTWGNGTTGIAGVVSSSNSLVGSTASDFVGNGVVTALSNGNYLVSSYNWGATDFGAVTWGNGTTGIVGAVSSINSLVGSTANDFIGSNGITALSNGNYVVRSVNWGATDFGAATWGNGTTGIAGVVSSSNSLVGSTTNDYIGNSGITALSNGNYVVGSSNWGAIDFGAVTWGSGSTGRTGVVSSINSLVGSTTSDNIGSNGITALPNGNYVVSSPFWSLTDFGAVTWGNGTTGIAGVVSSSNSLVGSTGNDKIGIGGIINLSNGNYVVRSYNWANGSATNAGAVTWGNGTTGIAGVVSSSNSLVGSSTSDNVGGGSITALSNGNYVVNSNNWNNGAASDAGAVTWGNGTSGIAGVVSSSNSLVGSSTSDNIGAGNITALSNGNYVVKSTIWDNGAATDAGAVTLGNGSTGVAGIITTCNSVIGTAANGGSAMVFAFNTVYPSLLVGRRADNIVTAYNPSGMALANSLDAVTVNINGTNAVPLIASAACRIIATITPNGGVTAVSGNVNAKVWIEAVQPSLPYNQYVKRHFEITPANNAATATAKVTLYFTQQEFDDFNAVSNVDLPQGPGDMSGIGNMLVEKRGGTSSDGSGLPATYSGAIETINPQDVDIIWNATNLRWEVSFDVTGFSGFFLKTFNFPLPVQWLQTNANLNSQDKAVINWQVSEQSAIKYIIEKSIDGVNFTGIGSANSKGDGTNNYSFTESISLTGTAYYRIKQISMDGSFTYSQIVALSPTGKNIVLFYPNPVKDKANLAITVNKTQLLQYRVIDNTGRIIATQKRNIISGSNVISIDVSSLAKGMYWIELKGETVNERRAFVK